MAPSLSANDILSRAREGLDGASASRVFGTPIERDGVTVVPVAVVSGGGGGGSGSGSVATGGSGSGSAPGDGGDGGLAAGGRSGPAKEPGQGEGSGGGFGFSARPAGVYVIKDGDVSWRPAVNVNAIVAGGQLVLLAALLVVRSVLRRRR
ncbi:sporulation protein [Actinoplanes sp. DH11]|uniref:sporulation protein n=1 Tax=Actinoplanes sp. DH11 TaxID=2857011 RepID=UPI001E2BAAF9|nr:sporulation protein [Actinoplanes sp. DH11]